MVQERVVGKTKRRFGEESFLLRAAATSKHASDNLVHKLKEKGFRVRVSSSAKPGKFDTWSTMKRGIDSSVRRAQRRTPVSGFFL